MPAFVHVLEIQVRVPIKTLVKIRQECAQVFQVVLLD